jgi:hypothetical protein
VFEQELARFSCHFGQLLVLDGLAVIGKRARDVRASHFEQELAFFTSSPSRASISDDSSRGERGHRHLARHIRADHAGYVELGRGDVLSRRGQWKLIRVVHLEIVGVQVGFNDGGSRTRVRPPQSPAPSLFFRIRQ